MNRRRSSLYGTLALVGAWSAWIVAHPRTDAAPAATVANRPLARSANRPAATPATPAITSADPIWLARADDAPASPSHNRLAAKPTNDAFATRQWVAPPPPPPPAPVVTAPPPPPPAPPPLPTLPYRFVGLLDEGTRTPTRVFLALGEKLIVARAGDQLDGGFHLDAINGQELVFTHIQTNVTLKMAVAGGKL